MNTLVCRHENTTTCKKPIAGGGFHVMNQCTSCGERVGNWLRHADYDLDKLPVWDGELHERQRELRYERLRETDRATREQIKGQDAEWWQWYTNVRLKRTDWQEIRHKVFQRSGGMCEGCMTRRAVQVHHKTYENVGNEFLWELVAVCMQCHRRLHPHMKENR